MKGRITISKVSSFDGQHMRIELADDASGIRFVEVKMSLEALARALTNEAYVEVELETRGLENVGKVKETKPLVFEVVADFSNRKEKAAELAAQMCDEGWMPSIYFGSQDSFFERDGKTYARTTQFRFTEPT